MPRVLPELVWQQRGRVAWADVEETVFPISGDDEYGHGADGGQMSMEGARTAGHGKTANVERRPETA
jgi:hypothetical protein